QAAAAHRLETHHAEKRIDEPVRRRLDRTRLAGWWIADQSANHTDGLGFHRVNDKTEPAALLSLAIELRHILQVESLRDRRGQLASLKNAQLRLEVRLRILVVVTSGRRIEPGDRSTVLVFDQHARGSAVHR